MNEVDALRERVAVLEAQLDAVAKAVKGIQKVGHEYGAGGRCNTAYGEGMNCNVYDVFEKKFTKLGFIKP